MRVAIQTLGTRGDVQPYIALARALMARGHEVQLCAPAQFEGLVSDHNVPFAPVPGEFLALLDKPEGKAAVAGSKGFGAGEASLGLRGAKAHPPSARSMPTARTSSPCRRTGDPTCW